MRVIKGIVKSYSRNKKRVAVLTAYGYTVFDIHLGDVSIGDEIIGYLDDVGSCDLTNLTTTQKLSVYIEAIQADETSAQSLLDDI